MLTTRYGNNVVRFIKATGNINATGYPVAVKTLKFDACCSDPPCRVLQDIAIPAASSIVADA